MSEEKSRPLTLLDEMVSDDSVQILKAAFPYIPKENRQLLSVYAKFLELQNTFALFLENTGNLSACEAIEDTDPTQMLTDIRRYCSPSTQTQIDRLLETLATVQMFEMLQEAK